MTSLHESVEAWIDHLADTGRSIKTIRCYSDDLRILIDWASARRIRALSGLTLQRLEEYRDELLTSRTPHTVARYVSAIRSWLRWAHESGQIRTNPAAKLSRPTVVAADITPTTRLTTDDLPAALGSARTLRDKAIIAVMAATGLSAAKLAGLTLNDVSAKDRTIRVGPRAEPIPASAWRHIEAYLEERAARVKDAHVRHELPHLWMRYQHDTGLEPMSVRQIQIVTQRARAGT